MSFRTIKAMNQMMWKYRKTNEKSGEKLRKTKKYSAQWTHVEYSAIDCIRIWFLHLLGIYWISFNSHYTASQKTNFPSFKFPTFCSHYGFHLVWIFTYIMRTLSAHLFFVDLNSRALPAIWLRYSAMGVYDLAKYYLYASNRSEFSVVVFQLFLCFFFTYFG